jgi:hypothetical protein
MQTVIRKNHWGVGISKERFLAVAAKALADDERFARPVIGLPGVIGTIAHTGCKPRPIKIGELTFISLSKAKEWFGCQDEVIHRALRRGLFPVRVDVECRYVEVT